MESREHSGAGGQPPLLAPGWRSVLGVVLQIAEHGPAIA